MKDMNKTIKLFQCLTVIVLFYIAGYKSMFLYASTLSLYNIFMSCFSHITIKDTVENIKDNYSKFKILKYVSIIISVICLLFVLISILLSDTINIFLNIDKTFLPYTLMSISILPSVLIKILLEYLGSYNKPRLSYALLNTYYILEIVFLLLIALFTMVIFKLPIHISISLLYLSRILSFILIGIIVLFVLNRQNINFENEMDNNIVDCKKLIVEVLKRNNYKSIVRIVGNAYYYISIIILYMVLSTRYGYNILEVENVITFIYLYGLTIINYLIDSIIDIVRDEDKINVIGRILSLSQFMITIAIILGFTSPLICKIIFGDSSNSIYFMMLSFLAIFIALYKETFNNIKNKRLIYASLIIGIISKLILVVPLINAFYRMGYNLIFGDVFSTIISMLISIIINYVYLKSKNKKEKTLDRLLTIFYENSILCILLVVLQFIVPINTTSVIKSIFVLAIYIFVSVLFLKMKKKRRG